MKIKITFAKDYIWGSYLGIDFNKRESRKTIPTNSSNKKETSYLTIFQHIVSNNPKKTINSKKNISDSRRFKDPSTSQLGFFFLFTKHIPTTNLKMTPMFLFSPLFFPHVRNKWRKPLILRTPRFCRSPFASVEVANHVSAPKRGDP